MTKELKTHYYNFLFKALIFSALAIFGISCSKTTEKIGNGLLPENDHFGVLYTDTIEIVCHSEVIDTMATKNMSTLLLGSMMDPVMGRTNAGFVTQLHLSAPNQRFGAQPVVDSVVLQLALSGYYGDTTTMQTVHVYALADSLSASENYYQFSDTDVEPTDLANGYQYTFQPKTTGWVVGSDTLTNAVIRIPLDNSFGQYLMDADTSFYAAADVFKQYCYGLKVCCESVSEDGGIAYISPLLNDVTVLQLYYHDEAEEEANGKRYNYYITSTDTYYSQYDHDYSLGEPGFIQQVINHDTLLGQQVLYLQSMGGIRSLIQFPNLRHWEDSLAGTRRHLILNEAKLILPASAQLGDSSVFVAPSSLALLSLNADSTTSLVPDYYEGTSYYGGTYTSSTKSVTFRIAEYLQRVMQGKTDSRGLYLSITGAAYNAQRWIIAGPEGATSDAEEADCLRCEIKYSIVGE